MSAPAKVAGSAVALLTAVLVLALAGPIGAAAQGENRAPGDHGLVLVGRTAVVDEPIAGDLQALGGSVRVDSTVAGDVIALGSDIEFGPEGRVEGSVIALGGSVRGLRREAVGGEVWAPAGVVAALGEERGGEAIVAMLSDPFSLVAAAIKLVLTLFWIAVAVLVVLVAGREVRESSLEVRAGPFYSFLLGLVAFTSFVLTALVFAYLVPYGVGVLLLAILGAVAVVAKIYGMVAVFHAIGVLLAGPRTPEAAHRGAIRGDLALTVVGAVTLGALRLVPLVGNVVWVVASIAGIGVALATGLGRREPWFLSRRTTGDLS